jgi:hypothetical protein
MAMARDRGALHSGEESMAAFAQKLSGQAESQGWVAAEVEKVLKSAVAATLKPHSALPTNCFHQILQR